MGAESGPFDPSLDRLRRSRAVKWHHVEDDVLAAGMAETDFDLCPAVVDAVRSALERGDLGYPDWQVEPLAEAFCARMATRHGWLPGEADVRHVCDLIQAFQVVVELATGPGDAVALHVPNYPPFLRSIQAMGRRAVACPLEPVGGPEAGAGGWAFDAERLAAAVAGSGAKVLLVVNPHNPTGRVLSRDELESLADIACRHDMVVVSDELHAELLHGASRHVPFASLGDEAASRTVTITSATKSFNLGGLRSAVAHVGHAGVRAAWDRLPPEHFGSLNVVGVEATLAAWRHGDEWLDAQCRHLTAMRDHLVARARDLPGVSIRSPEATYLAWLDCRRAALPAEPAAFFLEHARVDLVPGTHFGPGGEGHARLNFGTGVHILDQVVDRMAASLAATRPA
jgi:bifunctional pyridoxal-dependent enzyme with beta-cystathionase and maltose regulon repressor activities